MPKKNDPFEFNAPQYLDFTQGIPEDTDDSYFELAPEDSPKATDDEEPQTATIKPSEPPTETDKPPAMAEEPQGDTEMSDEPPTTTDVPQTVTQEPDTPMEVTEPETATEPPTAAEEPETAGTTATATPEVLSAVKAKKNRRRSKSVGVRQSPRLIAISKALRRIAAARSSPTSQPSSPNSSRAKGSLVTKVQAQKKGNNRVAGVASLTQEDKTELNTVATFRQKISDNNKRKKETHAPTQPLKPTKPQEFHFATDQRLRNHQETQPAPAPVMPAPSRPVRAGPTKPLEFTFATDARLKGKDMAKEEMEGPVEFARMLRSSSTASLNKDSAGAGSRGPTIPQPFHFSDTRRHHQQQAEDPQKFVSMAELNLKFMVGTPERFRTKRAGSVESQEGSKKPRGVTMPHTPNLTAGKRRRSLSVMTQEEREMKEFEEAQKHAFKAKPVNKKVFGTPSTGYRVEKKMLTVPEPFNITDSKKAPPSLSDTLTTELSDTSLMSVVPYGGIPLQATRKMSKTKIKPFSFDERDKAMMENKQQKIQKFVEEEKSLAEFHARPMPVFEDGVHGVPPKKPPTPTQAKPFTLRVEQRGSTKQEKFKQQLEKEEQWEAEQRRFHAQGDDVVHKMAFIPEKSKKPLTEISNFTLKTEVRAGERSEYELQQKAIEEEMLAAKKREEERRAAEELAEVARMRQEAVHKAQPVPNYKPMLIKPSPQPLTIPESPNFATNTRLRSRSRANSTFSVDM